MKKKKKSSLNFAEFRVEESESPLSSPGGWLNSTCVLSPPSRRSFVSEFLFCFRPSPFTHHPGKAHSLPRTPAGTLPLPETTTSPAFGPLETDSGTLDLVKLDGGAWGDCWASPAWRGGGGNEGRRGRLCRWTGGNQVQEGGGLSDQRTSDSTRHDSTPLENPVLTLALPPPPHSFIPS